MHRTKKEEKKTVSPALSSSVSLFSMYYYYTKIISSDLSARWSLCTGCKTPQANFNQNIRNRNRFDCDEFERMNKNPSTGIPKKNKSHKWNRKLHFSVSSLILCHFVSVFDLVSFRFVLLCLWLWFFICLFLCLCLSSYRNHVESFNRWFHWYCGCGWVCVCVFILFDFSAIVHDPNAHTQNNTFDQFSGFLYRFDLPIYKQQLNTRNDVLAKYNQWPFSAKIYDDKMTCGTTHILTVYVCIAYMIFTRKTLNGCVYSILQRTDT